ncbi:DMT family transporter [Photobacterium sp. 1_MG-2023]|uniref:DMT family transporter n=1 Tax=Photobacterium sp. 1_MG-2023 TaxID=3062646 RepID=UPI0026E3AF73|nr:DMT family transporter [Photobacterium sp. 1_MG-2023]MDO6708309.1 DMT family transporter [Photobacterium sp. 1_MG-2023]
MTSDFRPLFFMLASTFSLSVNGLVSKLLSDQISIELLSLLRFALPALLLMWLMSLTQWAVPDNRKLWQSLAVRAFCVAAAQLCFLFSLSHLSLVETVVLFSTGPLFIPVLEKLLFKTQIQSLTVANLIITFLGVMLMAGSGDGLTMRPELLVGVAAGVFNAGSQVSLYRVSQGTMSAFGLNAWCFTLASLMLVPLVLFTHNHTMLTDSWQQLTDSQSMVLPALLLLAICIVNTQVFRVKAYRLVESGSELAPLILTNLMFAFLWQIIFFEQSLVWNKVLGVSLIVLAMLMNTFGPIWFRQRHARLSRS